MLTVTDTMASHTCLAGVFLPLNQHYGYVGLRDRPLSLR